MFIFLLKKAILVEIPESLKFLNRRAKICKMYFALGRMLTLRTRIINWKLCIDQQKSKK